MTPERTRAVMEALGFPAIDYPLDRSRSYYRLPTGLTPKDFDPWTRIADAWVVMGLFRDGSGQRYSDLCDALVDGGNEAYLGMPQYLFDQGPRAIMLAAERALGLEVDDGSQ